MNSPLPFSTPSRQTGRTSTSNFRTPRSRPRGPSSQMTKTPGSAHTPSTPNSRYIPCRLDENLEFSRFKMATPDTINDRTGHKTSTTGKTDQSRQVLMDQFLALKGQKNNDRLLGLTSAPSNHDKYEYWETYRLSTTPTSSTKKRRKTPRSADKVLDAPNLINDFYLNVLDWSSSNFLAVALGTAVYIFDVARGDIQQLCDVEVEEGEGPQYVSSLRWDQTGQHIAVATNRAEIKLWDVATSKCVRVMRSHKSRVSSLSWHPRAPLLSSGARSGHIHNYDTRSSRHHVTTARAHKLDVCGLQWSASGRFLASGGNDNIVNIWDHYSNDPWKTPSQSFTNHTAAIKALAWCPWQPSILASGGGTADKSIRLWNVCSGDSVGHTHTDSQVSGLIWSSAHRELLSCHGNSSNSLRLWKWLPGAVKNTPSGGCGHKESAVVGMQQVGEIRGHEGRILHMCSSPDKETVVTAAADETLRFWRCFEGEKNLRGKVQGSPLSDITISSYIR